MHSTLSPRLAGFLLAASFIALVLIGAAEGAKKPTPKDADTCEDQVKKLAAATKALLPKIEDLKPLVSGLDTSELARVWRLYRNQQSLVEDTFRLVASEFSKVTRERAGIVTFSPKADADRLGDVFFSGQPYFVQCAQITEPLHRAFTDSASLLVDAGITPAALDCHERCGHPPFSPPCRQPRVVRLLLSLPLHLHLSQHTCIHV